jgi:hypothetical protein
MPEKTSAICSVGFFELRFMIEDSEDYAIQSVLILEDILTREKNIVATKATIENELDISNKLPEYAFLLI